MLKNEITSALNEQINRELYSAYLYLGISAWYDAKNLPGFANWYRVQSQEERDHAMLIFDYLLKSNAMVDLKTIQSFDQTFQSLEEPLKAALKHEYFITSSIEDLYSLATQHKDYRTTIFLEWFIKEQTEEENNAEQLVNQFVFVEGDAKAVLILDQALATRIYNPITSANTNP
ncbi:MAG: ferritin [Erysipelotrichaceae bacterium]